VKIRNTDWQIAVAYVGTVVGAGFASGQELMQFFVKFGIKGLYGAALAGIFFIVLGAMTIFMTGQYRFRTYKDLLDLMLGPKLALLIDGAVIIFLFLGFSVMLSGSGALFKEHLGLPSWIGIFLTEGLVLVALLARHEGVLWFNFLLIPLLIAVLGIVSVGTICSMPVSNPESTLFSGNGSWVSDNWICSSVLYVSYNMVGAVVVLVALAADKRNCSFAGGMLGGGLLSLLVLFAVGALLSAGSPVFSYQIPMLYLAYQVNPAMFYLYGAVLWAAMITTAIANAYGLARRLQYAWNVPYFFVMSLLLILAIPLSLCDFVHLVARVYPLFGYLSMIITFVLTIQVWGVMKEYLGKRAKKKFPR